jgi:hypothetical protein
MISVIKAAGANGKEYTNIAAIMSVPPAIKKAGMPSGHNALTIFSIDEPDMTMFDSFSDGLKQKIQGSPEWQARNGGGSSPAPAPEKTGGGFEDMDDDIPF